MFDKLIESNSAEAEFKPRRKFFMMSSIVVGIMFLSAVVFSLYAQDLDLGTDNFELAVLLAPLPVDAPEPEPPTPLPQQSTEHQPSELPNRPVLIASIEQTPQTPPTISTTPNKYASIPLGAFTNIPGAPESNGSGSRFTSNGDAGSSSENVEPAVAEVKAPEPPPVAPKPAPKKTTTLTKGVVNGVAIDLPKPTYPAVALRINLSGNVNVQVLIDETGNVVSARAIDGHPFLKAEAERAAKKAKFKPTLLSGDPVKVNGVIVYKFTR